LKGCPDRDGDGIKDKDDACPDQAGLPELKGCTKELREHPKTDPLFQIDQIVHFAYNSITLYQIAQNTLNEVVGILKQHPQHSIEIQANTDSIGSVEFNYNLSLKRAEAVKVYLISKGIKGERLKIRSFGKSNPIRPNSSERGRALNRRVEFRVID
jgi:OOP family OmpA-OmpF porin